MLLCIWCYIYGAMVLCIVVLCSNVMSPIPYFLCPISYIICHMSYVIAHSSCYSSRLTTHDSRLLGLSSFCGPHGRVQGGDIIVLML
jgi:hypothetical protein